MNVEVIPFPPHRRGVCIAASGLRYVRCGAEVGTCPEVLILSGIGLVLGSLPTNRCRHPVVEGPKHEVTISQPFYFGMC